MKKSITLLIFVFTQASLANEFLISCKAVKNILSHKTDGSIHSISRKEEPFSLTYIPGQSNSQVVTIDEKRFEVTTTCAPLIKKSIPALAFKISEITEVGGERYSESLHPLESLFGYANAVEYQPTATEPGETGRTRAFAIRCFWSKVPSPTDCK